MRIIANIFLFCIFFNTVFLQVKAQTSFDVEKNSKKDLLKNSPKFIDDIVLVQCSNTSTTATETNLDQPEKKSLSVSVEEKSSEIENYHSLQFKYALLTDNNVEEINNFHLYQFIDEWWATKYLYGGTTKDGIDCSAFAGCLMKEVFNLTIPRTAKEQYDNCDKILRFELKEGDLVFFNTRGSVSHVGVYLGNNYFVHSSVNSGVTINSLDDPYYNRKFIGAGRIIH